MSDKPKFEIGDIVKPREKALKKNKIFTDDKRLIVTKIDNEGFYSFNDSKWFYELALRGEREADFTLDEDELELVKKIEWT